MFPTKPSVATTEVPVIAQIVINSAKIRPNFVLENACNKNEEECYQNQISYIDFFCAKVYTEQRLQSCGRCSVKTAAAVGFGSSSRRSRCFNPQLCVVLRIPFFFQRSPFTMHVRLELTAFSPKLA